MSGQKATLKGKRVFFYFFMFFGFIATVNAAMIILATRTHPGIVTEHPYEKGLAYNKIVNAETEQEKSGWHGDISLRGQDIIFSLRDAQNKIITPNQATAIISRPTQAGMDFEVKLSYGEAQVSFPEKGLWEVRVFANIDDKEYQQAKRLVIQ